MLTEERSKGWGMAEQRGSKVERYLPLIYLAVALVLVIAVLPTVLRPPQQQPHQSAELSPDAPPDKDQQSIISSLGRGQSATAGSGAGVGAGEASGPDVGVGAGPGGAVPAPATKPSFCPNGFGNPRRQTESLYSAPCAAAFSGPNGGSTWHNVSANEIRIGLRANTGNASSTGPIPDHSTSGNNTDRTLSDMQRYFNQNYQLYGRRLQLVQLRGASSVADTQASVVEADQQWKLFGAVYTAGPASAEFCKGMAQHRLLTMCKQLDDAFFEQWAPYSYTWEIDTQEVDRLDAEYICKELAGKPAAHAGVPQQGRPRRFGLAYETTPDLGDRNSSYMEAQLKKQCGITDAVAVTMADSENQSASPYAATTAIARFQAENVTTIDLQTNGVNGAAMMSAAEAQGYNPEWIFSSVYWDDKNNISQLFPTGQMTHAFGLSAWEVPTVPADTECARALRTIDPGISPDGNACAAYFFALEQFSNGIQMAGPHLTPISFRDGLWAIGLRYYPQFRWSMGGGYAPHHWSYPNDVAEVWWDATAIAPEDSSPGAWRWVRNGKRYKEGEIPHEDPFVFTEGVASMPRE